MDAGDYEIEALEDPADADRLYAVLEPDLKRPCAAGVLAYRPRRFSTRLRLLPTFLTTFFTADAERPVFFAS